MLAYIFKKKEEEAHKGNIYEFSAFDRSVALVLTAYLKERETIIKSNRGDVEKRLSITKLLGDTRDALDIANKSNSGNIKRNNS